MSDGSKIEWTQSTWNPISGCTKVSDGCTNCYIERTPPFRLAGRRFDKPGVGGTTGVALHPERLEQPLKWRKPRRVFVNSLADLWHEDVPDGFIAAMWFIMGQSAGCIPEQYRGHTFQILTKRPARMRAWLGKWADVGDPAIPPMDPAALRCGRAELIEAAQDVFGAKLSYDWMDGPRYWPTALPGVWLGVSVETQQWADIRIPALLDIPAAVRWISAEPLLGPVDLAGYLPRPSDAAWYPVNCRHGHDHCPVCERTLAPEDAISWVVAGGESGPGARPMHPDWARSLRDQCNQAGVAYFLKQWGEWAPVPADEPVFAGDQIVPEYGHDKHGPFKRGWAMRKLGKKAGGRELDGRTWDEYPRAVS